MGLAALWRWKHAQNTREIPFAGAFEESRARIFSPTSQSNFNVSLCVCATKCRLNVIRREIKIFFTQLTSDRGMTVSSRRPGKSASLWNPLNLIKNSVMKLGISSGCFGFKSFFRNSPKSYSLAGTSSVSVCRPVVRFRGN